MGVENKDKINIIPLHKRCLVCKREFVIKVVTQKYCSDRCKKIAAAQRAGRRSILAKSLPSGTVGAISELLVAEWLMKKGYDVYRALSPASKSDLAISKNGTFAKVEVKTGYKGETGRITFPQKPTEDAHIFAVVLHNTNEIVFLNPKTLCKIDLEDMEGIGEKWLRSLRG